MKKMEEYFNEEADLHDDLFIEKMGLEEFYNEIEKVINSKNLKENILVLGCGSGLEIERIKFSCNVVGVDIAEKMLDVLKQKKLHEGIKLNTVCGSLTELDYGEDKFDIVLSCYVMHHFNCNQKQDIYNKIYSCLKKDGVFINGDSMAYDREEEDSYLDIAERIYEKENVPFASLHIDVPFCYEHEKEILINVGFSEVNLLKQWTNTKLYECRK